MAKDTKGNQTPVTGVQLDRYEADWPKRSPDTLEYHLAQQPPAGWVPDQGNAATPSGNATSKP